MMISDVGFNLRIYKPMIRIINNQQYQQMNQTQKTADLDSCNRETMNQLYDQLQWMQLKTETDAGPQKFDKDEEPQTDLFNPSVTRSVIYFKPQRINKKTSQSQNISKPQNPNNESQLPLLQDNQKELFDDLEIQSITSTIYGFKKYCPVEPVANQLNDSLCQNANEDKIKVNFNIGKPEQWEMESIFGGKVGQEVHGARVFKWGVGEKSVPYGSQKQINSEK